MNPDESDVDGEGQDLEKVGEIEQPQLHRRSVQSDEREEVISLDDSESIFPEKKKSSSRYINYHQLVVPKC